MDFVTEVSRRKHFFHALSDQEQGFIQEFHGQEFVLLIFFDREDFDPNQAKALAEEMLKANVRYIVCAGSAAEKVHDIFDKAITESDWETIRGETIVTTHHDQESIKEVLFQFVRLACPERSDPTLSLMVFPTKDKRAQQFIKHIKTIAATL